MLKTSTRDVKFWEAMQSPFFRYNSNGSLNILELIQSTQSIQFTNSLVAELSQVRIQTFQMGQELFSFNPADSKPLFMDDSGELACYLIREGRVRLLCQAASLPRQIPVATLEVGTCFGADPLFCLDPLPYRAIAATSGCVVKISYQELSGLLERFPQLHQYLFQLAQEREYLIFFKRFTSLKSQPSSLLKQMLPHIVKQEVQAGAALAQVTPAQIGHFWLRSGQISSTTNPDVAVAIGDSWGYPNTTPADWVAQTDLMVYKLPVGF